MFELRVKPDGRVKRWFSSPDRWVKGKYRDRNKGGVCFCLSGAISSMYFQDAKIIYNLVYEDLKIHDDYVGSVERWNDSPDRSFQDIMQVVERTGI